MKNKIHLSDLVPYLQNTHIKLDLVFLKKLLQNAAKSKHPAIQEDFLKKIGCIYNKNAGKCPVIYSWTTGRRTIPFSRLTKMVNLSNYSWNDIENNIVSIKSGIKRGEIFPSFPIKIGKEIGCVVGHILGDGSIEKVHKRVFFSNSNKDLLQEFRDSMNKLFGIEPSIWTQTRGYRRTKWIKRVKKIESIPNHLQGGLFYPKICGIILQAICGPFAVGKSKQITNKVLSFNQEFKRSLIRSFFDDEASVDAKSHQIRFHQDRKEILEGIQNLLLEFHITPRPIRFYFKRNKKRHYFNITGFREYHNFYHKIGCTSKKKDSELKVLIEKVQNSRSFKKKFAL